MGTDQQDTTCTSKDSHWKMTERAQMLGPRALLLFTIASFPRFCGYLGKFSLQNLGTSEQSAKLFPMKILFSTKSSPAKFSDLQ